MALPKVNAATYETTIPSTGRAVKYRPYLVKEEKILMIALESQDQKQVLGAVKEVIESCVFDDINVDELAIFDVEALFLSLRSKSVGEGVEVNIKCAECELENPHSVDLQEIEIPTVDQEKGVVMITDDVGVTMRYPTFNDMEDRTEEELQSIAGIMDLITVCIDTIFDEDSVHKGSDQTKKELTEFVDSLNSEQFEKLGNWFENMPAISYDLTFDCVGCKTNNSQTLRGLQSFFT